MTKDQIWELIEIKELLGGTDNADKDYGFNLLVEFIERNGFKSE